MKPKVFIGSSLEALDIAYATQQNLEHVAEVTVWNQGVFKVSSTSLDSLVAILKQSDFGIFVFSPDDIATIREKQYQAVRDNVIFELGLFIGHLGKNKCFLIQPRSVKDFRLPTDLLGVIPATYEANRQDGNLNAALGPACHEIKKTISVCGQAAQDSKPQNKSAKTQAEDIEQRILLLLAKSGDHGMMAHQIANQLNISVTKTEYYLGELHEKEMVYYPIIIGGGPPEYTLDHDGKEYLVKNDLID